MLYVDKNPDTIINIDEDLVRRISGDDEQAFRTLYRRYWEGLFITACKVLRSKEDAADMVQDVFLSLWKRRYEIRITTSVASYLYTSIRYKCINYIEKNIHRKDYLSLLSEIAEKHCGGNAEINLHLKEMEAVINRTVSKMPPKMQEVYKMSRQQHLSHKEIADSMSISVETVKKHIQHALNLIRSELPSETYVLVFILLSSMV